MCIPAGHSERAARPTVWPMANNRSVAGEMLCSSDWLTSSHRRFGHCRPDISFDLERYDLDDMVNL